MLTTRAWGDRGLAGWSMDRERDGWMDRGRDEGMDGEVKGRGKNFHIEYQDFQVFNHLKGGETLCPWVS